MADQGGVGVRLFVTGGEVVKRTFDQVGDSGRKMWSEVAAGTKDANPALKGLSAASEQARDKVKELGGEAGAAGGVLTAMGPAGIAAAAAIGGLAIAFEGARKGLEFADAIGDTAEKLKVSTDALQEYRSAIHAAGGEAADADAALQSFTTAFGAATSGLSKKAIKPFEALGFTQDELKNVKSATDLLPAIAERISKLASTAEQSAVADKLGLGPLLPLLRQGKAGVEELTRAAHESGQVMDADLIAKAGPLNDKLEELSHRIDIDLKTAFLDLIPVIQSIATLVESTLRAIEQMRTKSAAAQKEALAKAQQGDVAARVGTGYYERAAANFLVGGDSNKSPVARGFVNLFGPGPPPPPPAEKPVAKPTGKLVDVAAREAAEKAAEKAEAAAQRAADKAAASAQRAADKAQREREKAAEKAARAAEKGEQEIEAATKDELAARKALVSGIEAQADIQIKEIESELALSTAKREAEVRRGELTRATADAAQALADRAAEEKRQLVERTRSRAIDDEIDANERDIRDAYDGIAESEISHAKSAKERAALQLKLLEHDRAAERRRIAGDFDRRIADAGSDKDRTRIEAERATRLNSFDDQTASQRTEVKRANLGPLQAWAEQAKLSAAGVQEAFEQIEVDGIDKLNDGLIDAALHGKNLGEVLVGALEDALSSFLKLELRMAESSLFGGGSSGGGGGLLGSLLGLGSSVLGGAGGLFGQAAQLPGIGGLPSSFGVDVSASSLLGRHAAGGAFSPGDRFTAGESGPEIMVAGGSGQVFNFEDSRRMLQDLMPSGQAQSGAGGVSVHAPITIHANDAVLAQTVKGWVADGVRQAISTAGAQAGPNAHEYLERSHLIPGH